MIKITLPDGSNREYAEGITPIEIAKSISEGLARKVLAASVNGEVCDITRPINNDATFKLLTRVVLVTVNGAVPTAIFEIKTEPVIVDVAFRLAPLT